MVKAGKQSARRLASASTRRELALDMYVGGRSFQQIADALDYCDRGSAYRAVQTALAESAARTDELAAIARPVVVERLQRLYRKWARRAESEEKAAEIVLKILDRYIRVMGLDRPIRVEATVTTRSELDAEIEDLIKKLNAGDTPAPTTIEENQ